MNKIKTFNVPDLIQNFPKKTSKSKKIKLIQPKARLVRVVIIGSGPSALTSAIYLA